MLRHRAVGRLENRNEYTSSKAWAKEAGERGDGQVKGRSVRDKANNDMTRFLTASNASRTSEFTRPCISIKPSRAGGEGRREREIELT